MILFLYSFPQIIFSWWLRDGVKACLEENYHCFASMVTLLRQDISSYRSVSVCVFLSVCPCVCIMPLSHSLFFSLPCPHFLSPFFLSFYLSLSLFLILFLLLLIYTGTKTQTTHTHTHKYTHKHTQSYMKTTMYKIWLKTENRLSKSQINI